VSVIRVVLADDHVVLRAGLRALRTDVERAISRSVVS